MRWLIFTILAIAALTLQSSIAPRVAPLGARPDWLLVFVVFIALHAPPRQAIVAAWIIGGLADVMTIERVGLIAASYTLAAVAITCVRDYLFRDRASTALIVTLLACLAVRTLWTVYGQSMYGPLRSMSATLSVDVLLASAHTALWAVPLHRGLWGISQTLGLLRPRYLPAG